MNHGTKFLFLFAAPLVFLFAAPLASLPFAGSALPYYAECSAGSLLGANTGVLGGKSMTLIAMGLPGHGVFPMAQHVDHIALVSVPAQVLQSVVQRIAVVVTCLHARGAWANKRQQNGSVAKNVAMPADVIVTMPGRGDCPGKHSLFLTVAPRVDKSQPLELPVRISLTSWHFRHVFPVICCHQLASYASIFHPITA